jgi:tol-pal system protein YbgF
MMLRESTLAALAGLVLTGCSLSPSEPDPVQVKLDDVDRRVGQVERVVNNQSLIELTQRIDALQNEVRQLRGQVEELENSNAALRKQQRDLYADLEGRIAGLSGAAAPSLGGSGSAAAQPPSSPAGASSAATGAGSAVSEAAQLSYGRAFDALKAGQYPQAIKGFQDFLKGNPNGPLSDNAQYWLGEAFYVTRDYNQALIAFTRVSKDWPDSRKLPDALVKQGFALFELNRLGDARVVLSDVGKRFPGTEAARLAAERLKRIPADAR